jgi:NADH-quinone oxidoreductase subunit L
MEAAAEAHGEAQHRGHRPEGHAAPAETAEAEAARRARHPSRDATAAVAPKGAIFFMGPDNHVLHEAHYVPKWVKVSPFVAMVLGFLMAYQIYIRRPDLPGQTGGRQRRFTCSC